MKTIGNVQKDGQVRAVASGTLTDGKAVIINTNGTVSVVAGTATSIGTAAVFEDGTMSDDVSAVFDSTNNKVVVAYRDSGDSNYGKAVVGTVSGASISFGSPVTFNSGGYTGDIGAGFDANAGKVLIGYRNNGNSNYGTAIVGTVSGTSISFGTAAVFYSTQAQSIAFAYDSNAQKLVVCYRDDGSPAKGSANVCTISGTSVSFGSKASFESAAVDYVAVTYESNSNRILVAYTDEGNSNYGTAAVGEVSGTSISFDTPVVFEDSSTYKSSATFDSSNNKIVISYRNGADGDKGKAVVGTNSNSDGLSFGTPVVFNNASTDTNSIVFNPDANTVTIAFKDVGNSNHGTAIDGTVSGTSISFGSETVFEAASTDGIDVVYDTSNDKTVILFRDVDDSNKGKALTYVGGSTNITSENFIGFSDGAFATTQSAVINTANTIDRNQTSLTPGQTYFVTGTGALSTTAADPSVTAGTAISSTELIVKG